MMKQLLSTILIEKIENMLVKGLVFILPLFFLPRTALRGGIDNFAKLYLLYFAGGLAFIFWFLGFRRRRKAKPEKYYLRYYIWIFLTVYGLSSVFSLDRFSSFFGSLGVIGLPWTALFFCVLIYLVVADSPGTEENNGRWRWLLYGFALSVFLSLALTLGLWSDILGSQGVLADYFGLALGSLEDFAVYLAVVVTPLFGLLLSRDGLDPIAKRAWQRRLFKAALIISWLLLALINFAPAWGVMFAGIVTVIALNLYAEGRNYRALFNRSRLAWTLVALALTTIFLGSAYLNAGSPVLTRRLASGLQLDYRHTFELAGRAITHKTLLGYGPETFSHVFSLLRSADFNQTEFWYARFSRGASFLADLSISSGLAGVLSYALLIGYALYRVREAAKGSRFEAKAGSMADNSRSGMALVSAGAFIAAVAAQVIYSATITGLFLFWFFLASFRFNERSCRDEETAQTDESAVLNELSSRPWLSRAWPALAMVLAIGWFAFMGVAAKYWAAQAYYRKAQAEIAGAGTAADNRAERALLMAANLNPHRYLYPLALSKLKLQRTMSDLAGSENMDMSVIQTEANKTVAFAKQAVNAAPFSVVTLESLGMIYRALSPFAQGGNAMVISSFEAATRLEPTNPVLFTELGKAYSDNRSYPEAEDAFRKAIELKPDYYEAAFNLAKTYALENKSDEAIKLLAGLEDKYNQVDVFYEEGRVYFNDNNFKRAIVKFGDVLNILPNNANALYSLALALEATGDKAGALDYYKKVQVLNPDNEDVANRVSELEKIIK